MLQAIRELTLLTVVVFIRLTSAVLSEVEDEAAFIDAISTSTEANGLDTDNKNWLKRVSNVTTRADYNNNNVHHTPHLQRRHLTPAGHTQDQNSRFTDNALNIALNIIGNDSNAQPFGSEKVNILTENMPAHYRLENYLMRYYNRKLIPRWNTTRPITVEMSIALYQIIEVNEPRQYIQLNSWIVEKWEDQLLYWDPDDFDGLTEIILPYDSVWIPDTTLYNSLIMDDSGSRRLLDVKLKIDRKRRVAQVEMLYPTLHMFSCMLDLRYFPYDVQRCVMTFGSWTHDILELNFVPHTRVQGSAIDTEHCLENEGWNLLSSQVVRRELKFRCCPNKYALLDFRLSIQRKPLYYLVNLIVPTSIITLIAIVGFFSSPTINNERAEKITLGITTLLSMSILIFMVSDQMPSTSSFIPLIGWFYTSMMMLISGGTLASSFVIDVQKRGFIGQRPSSHTMRWARRLGKVIRIDMPLLMKQAYILKAKQDKLVKQQQMLAMLKLRYQQQQQQQMQKQQASQFQHRKSQSRRPTLWNILQRVHTGAGYGSTPPSSAVFQGMGASGTGSGLSNNNFAAFINSAMTDSTSTTYSGNAVPVLKGTLHSSTAPKWSSASLQPRKTSLWSSFQQHSNEMINAMKTSHFTPTQFSPVSEEPAPSSKVLKTDWKQQKVEDETTGVNTNKNIDLSSNLGKISVNAASPQRDHDNPNDEGHDGRCLSEFSHEMVSSAILSMSPLSSQARDTSCEALTRRRPIRKSILLPIIDNASDLGDDAMPPILSTQLCRSVSKEQKRPPISPSAEFGECSKDSTTEIPLNAVASMGSDTPRASEGASLIDGSIASAGAINGGGGSTTNVGKISASEKRNLAQIEYDWLAAVIERLFFIIFCVLFFFMSFGINVLGIYYWYFWTVDMISQR